MRTQIQIKMTVNVDVAKITAAIATALIAIFA